MRLQCCPAKYREMQRNAEKCREKQRNAEKCIRNSEKCRELLQKCREMKRNVWKCRGMQRNSVKYREMQICRDILMTFMIFMTFMTQGNVIFDILEPPAFIKYSTCRVLQKFEEPCKILKKFVYACVVNVIHAKALPGSVFSIAHKSESVDWALAGLE